MKRNKTNLNCKERNKTITVCGCHDIIIEVLKMPPNNYSDQCSRITLQNTKLIYRNLSHFYTLTVNYKKEKLGR